MNVKPLGIDFREHIQRTLGLHAGDAWDFIDKLPRAVALLVQTPARHNELANALIAT